VYEFKGTAYGNIVGNVAPLQEAAAHAAADPNSWHVCWCATEDAPLSRCCPLHRSGIGLLARCPSAARPADFVLCAHVRHAGPCGQPWQGN